MSGGSSISFARVGNFGSAGSITLVMTAISNESIPDDTRSFEQEAVAARRARRRQFLTLALEGARPMAPGARFKLEGVRRLVLGRGTRRSSSLVDGTMKLKLADPQLSREHAAIVRTPAGWDLVDLNSKNGTYVNGAEVTGVKLSPGDVVRVGGSFLVFRDVLVPALSSLGDLDLSRYPVRGVFDTLDVDLHLAFQAAARVAAAPVSILVRGESGTGKELVARELHRRSGRAGDFVALNCGAIPETLLESELFGYQRGAFSGAVSDKKGLVAQADRGTLFLDEVAQLSAAAQVTLLRVLQEHKARPVGATRSAEVDFRVIAATHHDLEALVKAGTFRRDLYARLAGYCIELPPLRARRDDLGLLVSTLLLKIVGLERAYELQLDPVVARAMINYNYPLNIRELDQALRAAVALSPGPVLGARHFPSHIMRAATDPRPGLSPKDQETRERLVRLLRGNQGNVSATARAMGKAPVQIRRWCRRFGIELEAFRAR